MKERITVLSVGKPYNFVPEGSNDNLSGCTMFYIGSDKTLTCVVEDGVLGYVPLKESMPVAFYEIASKVGIPCEADVVYKMRNSNGKQVLKIEGIDFVKAK